MVGFLGLRMAKQEGGLLLGWPDGMVSAWSSGKTDECVILLVAETYKLHVHPVQKFEMGHSSTLQALRKMIQQPIFDNEGAV